MSTSPTASRTTSSFIVLDYNSGGRSEQIQVTNVATGAVLGIESVSNFSDGDYMNWRISGNTLITITNKGRRQRRAQRPVL